MYEREINTEYSVYFNTFFPRDNINSRSWILLPLFDQFEPHEKEDVQKARKNKEVSQKYGERSALLLYLSGLAW
jgi:hypothetical protein